MNSLLFLLPTVTILMEDLLHIDYILEHISIYGINFYSRQMKCRYFYLHFTNEETKAQQAQVPQSHS